MHLGTIFVDHATWLTLPVVRLNDLSRSVDVRILQVIDFSLLQCVILLAMLGLAILFFVLFGRVLLSNTAIWQAAIDIPAVSIELILG